MGRSVLLLPMEGVTMGKSVGVCLWRCMNFIEKGFGAGGRGVGKVNRSPPR